MNLDTYTPQLEQTILLLLFSVVGWFGGVGGGYIISVIPKCEQIDFE